MPNGESQPDDQPRSARKRRAILEAATTVFLNNGCLGTSMDEIAALARVSKQTVYKQFADKERLFVEIVTNTVNEIGDPVYEEVLNLADSGDIEADLRDLARRLLEGVMQPLGLATWRVGGVAGTDAITRGRLSGRSPGRAVAIAGEDRLAGGVRELWSEISGRASFRGR